MGLIIGHIDLPSSDTPDNICDPDRDIPWTTLAHTAHAIRGHYTDVELISRPGILLSITRQGVTKHVAGYAHILFDGGSLVVHADGTAEHYDVRETADELGRWLFVYPGDPTISRTGTSVCITCAAARTIGDGGSVQSRMIQPNGNTSNVSHGMVAVCNVISAILWPLAVSLKASQ